MTMVYDTRTDPRVMNAETAIRELDDELGSGDDPIRYKGEDTTPNGIMRSVYGESASEVRMSFFGGPSLDWKQGSTLAAMVADRRRLKESEMKKEQRMSKAKKKKRSKRAPKVEPMSVARVKMRDVDLFKAIENGQISGGEHLSVKHLRRLAFGCDVFIVEASRPKVSFFVGEPDEDRPFRSQGLVTVSRRLLSIVPKPKFMFKSKSGIVWHASDIDGEAVAWPDNIEDSAPDNMGRCVVRADAELLEDVFFDFLEYDTRASGLGWRLVLGPLTQPDDKGRKLLRVINHEGHQDLLGYLLKYGVVDPEWSNDPPAQVIEQANQLRRVLPNVFSKVVPEPSVYSHAFANHSISRHPDHIGVGCQAFDVEDFMIQLGRLLDIVRTREDESFEAAAMEMAERIKGSEKHDKTA